jgi:trehalose 6-phosphate synthase
VKKVFGEKPKFAWSNTGKLVLISNRGPFQYKQSANGLRRVHVVSGLVSALEPVLKVRKGLWVAWSGSESLVDGLRYADSQDLKGFLWREVPLTAADIEGYYNGFANQVLWPLCHYFIEKCHLRNEYWRTYLAVNRKFARVAQAEIEWPDMVWVHDYHLSLVPAFLRYYKSSLKISFFWHIPFPQRDVFRILPWAKELLKGILGSDLIGFHLPAYVENFLGCVSDVLGIEVDFRHGELEYEGRRIAVRAFPVGVDPAVFQELARKETVIREANQLKQELKSELLALSIDRLDYSKGILERLRALELFWERNTEYLNRLTFVQIAVPTRSGVPAYRRLRKEVEELVSQINRRFGRQGWLPVHCYYRSFTKEKLAAFYAAADAALVTPLRDGLNLVAKEYVASKTDFKGVLVLSRFAGAAEEMNEAVLVNPYNIDDMEEKIKFALTMSPAEQRRRLLLLREKVLQHDSLWWVSSFLNSFPRENLHQKASVLNPGYTGRYAGEHLAKGL